MDAKVAFRLAVVFCTIMFVLYVSGCSALTGLATTAVTNSTEKPLVGVDTEVVAGDKTGAVLGPRVGFDEIDLTDNAQLHSTTTGEKLEFQGATDTVNIEEGVPFWQAGLAILVGVVIGIFLPQYSLRRKT